MSSRSSCPGLHDTSPCCAFQATMTLPAREGEMLVVDTIAIDERVRNSGFGNYTSWHPSDQERVIERFTRTSENYLTYQVTVIDPVVLERPFFSPPLTWTLAQADDDVWTEYLCTANEEPLYMEKMDPETRKLYE